MSDQQWMQRALELARLGLGNVSPNPMVGCVIVKDDKIIGEGYHEQYGGPHAEVNAVQAVKDQSLLAQSTAYVTLEPCSHFGKTPPCADLLVRHQVKRVVICNEDPNPLVAGQGIERLRNAGIEVEIGLLREEGRVLNRRFFTAFEKKRPYVILKWAQTADGFVARENYDSKWISNTYSRQLVHKWRAEEDAILVGTNTARYDNPSLTTRDWKGKNPVRFFIDRTLLLNKGMHLMDGTVPTYCFTEGEGENRQNLTFIQQEQIAPEAILASISELKIQSLIMEGGSGLLNSFIERGLWDEARVFIAPHTFGKGIAAPHISGELLSAEDVLGDRLLIYKNH
ncbi:bifunctional diaminohydroxyphosphoribosylaminopyrimidine deaminase/5-amino-6-(5-phosphoribosylamino)uracil reductase RibD [Marinoscillum sp. 108]|uniref:bifunctional diaminohydroxyphosphoribosylaminopyrimidine deaminase/5-amino-6-(5-phosphoribosylamino)uracil reductase RibD n=1 Tax=Marinoscillum sp. 108 TaxID=2653151 RepID=UPI00135A5511|nr:bifunctional diaminohydroxyphosphoribosylaminopyrimidine deaminase/5-amino-6-(5-phosphoribosylamino)uracil reductase RibD [Marinoscillum sp. 108]